MFHAHRFHSLIVIALLISTSSRASEREGDLPVKASSSRTEALFKVSYKVKCHPAVPFKGLTGSVSFGGRKIRFDLFEARNETELQLGVAVTQAQLHYEVSGVPLCQLISFEPRVEYVDLSKVSATDAQVLEHSPFVGIRSDQIENRMTDLPLLTSYTARINARGETVIQYTTFFSDEDSSSEIKDTQKHMARYGRRLDVEWVYEVVLGRDGKVVDRGYQGSDLYDFTHGAHKTGSSDLGHSTSRFEGRYLPGSNEHPILYNIADNNVFSGTNDLPEQARELTGYHLVPRIRVDYPLAREWVILSQAPWTLAVSDDEMDREGKLVNYGRSDRYLYVLVQGDLQIPDGLKRLMYGFRVRVNLDDHSTHLSGDGVSDIDRLGENMWEKQAYSAVPLGVDANGWDRLSRIDPRAASTLVHGEVKLERTTMKKIPGKITELKFYKLVRSGSSYQLVDVSGAFTCSLGELESTSCRF